MNGWKKTVSRPKPKVIPSRMISGQRGVNLIEQFTLEMGHVWVQRGIEAGIDGYIEFRDSASGAMTGTILLVQSKAESGRFTAETERSFEYLCDERDIAYWLNGNAPVALIVSRPDSKEAYWVSVKDYFDTPGKIRDRRVTFDKRRDRFDGNASSALLAKASPRSRGLYLAPAPKPETIYSSLLKVEEVGRSIFVASTDIRKRAEVYERVKRHLQRCPSDFFLKSEQIVSFHNLRELPWSDVCDRGTVEEFESDEWALSDNREKRSDFVQLLNQCLSEKLWHHEVFWHPDFKFYYAAARKVLAARRVRYRSFTNETSRAIFEVYYRKPDPAQPDVKRVSFYRHMGFFGSFERYGGTWYLDITPTYHYTSDGRTDYRFREDQLSGIKRIERNNAVSGQVLFWADYLRRDGSLFNASYPHLRFSGLNTFSVSRGIPDESWLKNEDEDEVKASQNAGDSEFFT